MIAVEWIGPGAENPPPSFLCVKSATETTAETDEWATETADEFRNELSARIKCDALRIPRAHWKPVPYPKHLTPEKPVAGIMRTGPKTYGSYTSSK